MSDTPRIVKTEDTCGGSPRVDGTRISVPVLLEHIAGYVDLSEIPRTVHRHVTIEDCQQALQYAANAVKQHDSLLAEVERLNVENDKLADDLNSATWPKLLDLGQRILDRWFPAEIFTGVSGDAGPVYIVALRDALKRVSELPPNFKAVQLDDRIASLEADNARLVSEQQHCAKCGGVECHALAGLFCGEHSYAGCKEWDRCPICVNARLAGENATVIEARNHLFGRVRALDIETVNQRTHIAQLREQNAALVEAVEAALKYGAFGVREVEVKQQLKSALAASGRGK